MQIQVTLWKLLAMHLAILFETSSAGKQETPRMLQGEATSIYNFPFVCTYHFTPPKGRSIVLGTCTIYTKGTVIFAIDTVDRLIQQTHDFWFQKVPRLTVIAGADTLDPDDPSQLYYAQTRKVKKFIVGLKEDMATYPMIITDPKRLDGENFERNGLGEVACDIGIFFLDKDWDFNPFILPIPLPTLNYETMVALSKEWVDRLEDWPWLYDSCTVAGWGPTGNNDLVTHELVYVARDECMESICAHHGHACLQYPVHFHHVCFKARNYGDVCVYDQGSPVFCPWFGRGIFAILVRSFDCGLENMPAVYAIVSYVTNFTKIALDLQPIEARPDFNDRKYIIPDTPPPTNPPKPARRPRPSRRPRPVKKSERRTTRKKTL